MSLKMENVNLVYDMGKELQTYALKNITISLKGNRMIGIMGPSGSGKSSLLYTLAGLKCPTSGKAYYNEIDYSKISPDENAELRKKNFGFIFQKHFLIDYMTVLQNVLTPINDDSNEAKMKAITILDKLDILHLSGKKPHQLSVGQKQKVAIARAFIGEPKVIFADEPTAALDHENALKVMDFFEEYRNKKMIIIVTHDKSILKNADSIVNMFDGSVTSIETGEGIED
ncbi:MULTISPECIES: ABC transporter ATP-binding protein [Clostridium]|uniref:ABC transporter ATP-binding protein n=1 Tax=Clostridium TaxID=1485 RepID=UPI000824CC5D|nr:MULTISPECIES: ABC transporter ATP-binding protein [Clostridium]PJI08965.1 ABC transporter ATP-binding protein [Clostridium sp. CT7]